jgi:uncharacterized protein
MEDFTLNLTGFLAVVCFTLGISYAQMTCAQNNSSSVKEQEDVSKYLEFYRALQTGNAAAAKQEMKGIKNFNDPELAFLHVAARGGNVEIIEALINAGADPNLQRAKFGDFALHFAVESNQLNAVKALIKRGAKVDVVKTINSFTPLMNACVDGNFNMARLLLESGAKINWAPFEGQATCLRRAIDRSSVAMIQYLLENGADPNQSDSLISAVIADHDSLAKMKLLLKFGAKADGNGGAGSKASGSIGTAIQWAAEHGLSDQVELLIAAGADTKQRNSLGQTLAEIAAKNNHLRLALKLRALQ